ncbi:hypothetical protein CFOL_v3_03542 [Cephalotus follicularis]|uniref:Uncharacterized protein n=1 Tax=Cephalotus follicularis TaxID=3775 RepID=A0A1Q3AW91_CEPFO|nr:hypothetical protein CFOL_v3_03542 [Cephalotus follicularis]
MKQRILVHILSFVVINSNPRTTLNLTCTQPPNPHTPDQLRLLSHTPTLHRTPPLQPHTHLATITPSANNSGSSSHINNASPHQFPLDYNLSFSNPSPIQYLCSIVL